MIVNISGTSGSGKTYIVKKLMSLYDDSVPLTIEGKKRRIGSLMRSARPGVTACYIPGHYDTACGGVDTLNSIEKFTGVKMLDFVFQQIRKYHDAGCNVLFEGLLVTSDKKRIIALHKDGYPILNLSIKISLQECYDSIYARREAAGNFKPLNPKATRGKYRAEELRREALAKAGIGVRHLVREEIYKAAADALGIGAGLL